jgi:hypothetical protein
MRITKTSEVLRHLKEHGSITSMEAFELYGATRLSAIVFQLRRKGHPIVSKDERGRDRYGHMVTFSRYVYERKDD